MTRRAGTLLLILLTAAPATGEVNLDPGDVSYPSSQALPVEDDFHGIDFEVAPDYREDWKRHAGILGPTMTDEGVRFRHHAPDANFVSIVGDFNDWDPEASPLARDLQGTWSGTVPIEDGGWRYAFVVDGERVKDPENPASRETPANLVNGTEPAAEQTPSIETSYLVLKHGAIAIPRPAGVRDTRANLTGTYDRVNAVALAGSLTYENRVELHPRLGLGLGYSFGRERMFYEVSAIQPFFGDGIVDIGASAYRRNATPDADRVDDVENTLATFFFREDWRDYYEAEGIAATTGWNITESQRLGLRWRQEDHRAVTKTTDWGLFGGDKAMRENPAADEGELHGLALNYVIDTRNDRRNPNRGMWVGASYEWAGEDFGGDFQFRKGVLDVRRYQEISRGYYADFRVSGGHLTQGKHWMETGTVGMSSDWVKVEGWGAYPEQEKFYLGGVGTMRATQFKSLAGDRMLLANAEFRVEIFHDFQAAVFADIGDAWNSQQTDPDIHTDAGIGFQDSESSFRVNFAKKMDRDDDEIFVSARIRRMF